MENRSPLELIEKLYQQSVWPEIRETVRRGWSARPLVVELDPTSQCDLACPECINADVLGNGAFSPARLLEIAHELVVMGVHAVILIGGGEPLLHPAISEVLGILHNGGVRIGITTNGTQLHRHMPAIADYASWTRVSLDCASAEAYAWVRPSHSGANVFPSVIDNIRQLAAGKTGSLGYSYMLITRTLPNGRLLHNFGEVLAAARLARELGCDYFEIKPCRDARHFVLPIPREFIGMLTEQIAAAQALVTADFQVVTGSGTDVALGNGSPVERKPYARCWAVELRTLITPHGCYLCPYHRGDPARQYGEAHHTPLAQLWESAHRRQVCTATQPDTACRFNCVRHATNIALAALAKTDRPNPPLLPDYDAFI
ncbi:MAG TPA: radical SAM protein [Armatimonadota bacterium]|jgi:MoaA/NifB/PqqE/SkfB family radical SAM enzyme